MVEQTAGKEYSTKGPVMDAKDLGGAMVALTLGTKRSSRSG